MSTTGTGNISIGKTLVTQHVLPVTDITYDLGSATYRYKDLWLSGSSIHLGGATISSTGTSVNLPAGSTLGGVNLDISTLPSQSGKTDLFLRTNGSIAYWTDIPDPFPDQLGQGSKFLTTDGNSISWGFTPVFNGGTLANALIVNNNVTINGNLTVTGTSTLINSTTVTVEDKNIELGTIDVPTDLGADGGGITLKGDTDKTLTWALSTNRWTSNIGIEATSFTGDITGNVTGNVVGDVTGSIKSSNTSLTVLDTSGATATFTGNVNGVITNGVVTTSSYYQPTWITGLSISQGGTGADNSSDALANLLPSGEQSGYILKTSGPGSYFWAAEIGASTIIGTKIDTTRQTFTVSGSPQTDFTVSTYTVGAGQLRIYVDGARQFPSEYSETSSTTFSLTNAAEVGSKVFVEIDAYKDYTVIATAVTYNPQGGLEAVNVQDAISELDSEKSPKADAILTGNTQVDSIAFADSFINTPTGGEVTTSATTIDTWDATKYRSATYTVQATNTVTGHIEVTTLVLIHKDGAISKFEYNRSSTSGSPFMTYNATIASNVVTVTGLASTNTAIVKGQATFIGV